MSEHEVDEEELSDLRKSLETLTELEDSASNDIQQSSQDDSIPDSRGRELVRLQRIKHAQNLLAFLVEKITGDLSEPSGVAAGNLPAAAVQSTSPTRLRRSGRRQKKEKRAVPEQTTDAAKEQNVPLEPPVPQDRVDGEDETAIDNFQTTDGMTVKKKRRRPLKKGKKVVESAKLLPSTPLEKLEFYVQRWKELNAATADSSIELYDLCVYSETLIIEALRNLPPYFCNIFIAKLKEEGYEVRDEEYHVQQARFFLREIQDPEYRASGIPESERQVVDQTTGHILQLIRLAALIKTDPSDQINHLLDIEEENLNIHPRLDAYQQDNLQQDGKSLSQYLADQSCHGKIAQLITQISSNSQLETIQTSEDNKTQIDQSDQNSEANQSDTSQEPPPNRQSFRNATMAPIEIALPLPVLPEGWSAEGEFKAIGSLTPATQRSIEPVGPHFLAHARRARHKRTFSEDDKIQAQENVKKVEDDDAGEISEPEDPMMLSRDAKDWKGQDHYAVLGLSKYRYKASEEQIKRAHRKKVLRHHPDKKAAAGSTEDDSFFKCIQKATEVLLDPVKRRQFDSVDEHADVEPPTKKQTQKGNFYKLWSPVFKAEGRFSKTQPVPKLGDENSTKEDVENFYNFWYNFDSWRSFEYQDEDVPDDNENRDQKRHVEKKNNNARKKKKTEDSARLRKLLDDASALDERIKKFRNEANASKNKKRLDKEAAEKKAIEDAKAKKLADEEAAKKAEEAAKIERDQGKKAKEAAKNAVKKNKRVLKGSVKDANYFVSGDAPASTIDAVLNDVELIQGKIDADEIAALAGKLNGLKVADEIKGVWTAEVKRLVGAGKLNDGDVKTIV